MKTSNTLEFLLLENGARFATGANYTAVILLFQESCSPNPQKFSRPRADRAVGAAAAAKLRLGLARGVRSVNNSVENEGRSRCQPGQCHTWGSKDELQRHTVAAMKTLRACGRDVLVAWTS